jgi:hypothetical protein
MQVVHDDASATRLYLAKIASWTWAAYHFKREHPETDIPPSRLTGRAARVIRLMRLPEARLSRLTLAASYAVGGLLDRSSRLRSLPGTTLLFRQCVRTAGFAGFLMFEAGLPEPMLSDLIK